VFARAVRAAIAKVSFDVVNAHDGPTFERLKRAHPHASDDEVRKAIKSAVKLDQDCQRFFSYGSNYGEDLRSAVEAARKANPGFQDETYRRAELRLGFLMR
jgi:hypothetical protein